MSALSGLTATNRSSNNSGLTAEAPGAGGTLDGDGGQETVASQLATVLAPAARQPDGSYQVTIRLQPEDLGAVHVELHLEGSTVNVSLHADGDATRDMLRQNLDQLRQQLESGGLSTGRFDVGSGPASDGEGGTTGQERAPTTPQPGYQGQTGEATTGGDGRPLVPTSTNALLDMRL